MQKLDSIDARKEHLGSLKCDSMSSVGMEVVIVVVYCCSCNYSDERSKTFPAPAAVKRAPSVHSPRQIHNRTERKVVETKRGSKPRAESVRSASTRSEGRGRWVLHIGW